jgi:hypothetical protein
VKQWAFLEWSKMNLTDISIIAAAVALVLFAGLMFYLMYRSKKENCCEIKTDPMPAGLAEGTNDGLQPGKFWGAWGAPWQIPSSKTDNRANLAYNAAQSSEGWGYSPWLEPPDKASWWGPQYSWFFDPNYWTPNVAVNPFNQGHKMCIDRYKQCVDSLGPNPDRRCVIPFEQCIMSIPKVDEVSIGH